MHHVRVPGIPPPYLLMAHMKLERNMSALKAMANELGVRLTIDTEVA